MRSDDAGSILKNKKGNVTEMNSKILNFSRKAFASAMAGLMFVPVGVHAEEPTYGTTSATIDKTRKGSITLYKYVDNNGKTVDADGISYTANAADMLGAVRNQLKDDDIFPEKGVKFRAIKVADIDQVTEVTENGINATGTYYTNIDQQFFQLLKDYLGTNSLVASETTRVTDGRVDTDDSNVDDHYETDELNEKIQMMNRSVAKADGSASVTGEVALNRYVRQRQDQTYSFDATDENGFTKVEDMDLGLYLICEIDYEHGALSKHDTYWEYVNDNKNDMLTGDKGDTSEAGTENSGLQAGGKDAGGSQYADVASPSSPFLISVPMTNVTDIQGEDGTMHTAGTVWQYDIVAYPKNGTINIHKDIVLNDFSGLTNGGNDADGLTAADGNDVAADKTLCNNVQVNYLPEDGTEDAVDGKNKSGLTHQIDANIGDIITQVISADVPRLTDDIDNEQPDDQKNSDTATRKHNATYKITDRMTKGLKLIDHQSFKVTLSTGAWNDYGANTLTFTEGEDYALDFAEDKQSYVLTILPAGLKKMDDISAASYLYVRYDVELTKDALIGTDTYGNQRIVTKAAPSTEANLQGGNLADELVVNPDKTDTSYDVTYDPAKSDGATDRHPEATNQNTAMLTYATDRTMEHDYYSNTTKVFTYEMDLTKLFTDGTAGHISKNDTNAKKNSASFDYSAVKFTVRGSVKAGSEDFQNAGGEWEQMIFIRTGDGTYRVFDKYTDGGDYDATTDILDQPAAEKSITKYLTPNSETGLLTIAGVDARMYEFTEVATAPGRNLMASQLFVKLEAPVVADKTLENGSVEHAYIYTDANAATALADLAAVNVNKARMDEGRVPFTIQNNEFQKLLKTGGYGTYAYYIIGGAVVAIGIYFFAMKKREDDSAENDA